MQAVILAAGLGRRMGDLTKDLPKPLLTIENKTLLEHNFTSLPDAVVEVILVVGYLADQIKEAIGDFHSGRKVVYVQQRELLGTGQALSLCKSVLKGRFLVLMGDDLYAKRDLEKMIMSDLCMLVYEIEADELENKAGLVIINSSGLPIDILEKQPAKKGALLNCGAYMLDEKYFTLPLVLAEKKTKEYGLPQTMLQMLKNGSRFELVKATWWHKVTQPKDLKVFLRGENA